MATLNFSRGKQPRSTRLRVLLCLLFVATLIPILVHFTDARFFNFVWLAHIFPSHTTWELVHAKGELNNGGVWNYASTQNMDISNYISQVHPNNYNTMLEFGCHYGYALARM